MVIQVEGGHPHLEPWPQGDGMLDKALHPQGLHLASLAIQDRRRQGLLLPGVIGTNVAGGTWTVLVVRVAAQAVVAGKHLTPVGDRLVLLVHLGVVGRRIDAIFETRDEYRQILHLRVGKMEVRHLQQAGLELPRIRQLHVDKVGDVAMGLNTFLFIKVDHVLELVTKGQSEVLLVALEGDLRAVEGAPLEPGDRMAAGTVVPLDAFLPGFHQLRVIGLRHDVELRHRAITLLLEEGGDRIGLLVGEAQTGHGGLRIEALRVLHPCLDPLAVHLVPDLRQVRTEVALEDGRIDLVLVRRGVVDVVAAEAAHRQNEFLAACHLRGRRRHVVGKVGRAVGCVVVARRRLQIGGNLLDLIVGETKVRHVGLAQIGIRVLQPSG